MIIPLPLTPEYQSHRYVPPYLVNLILPAFFQFTPHRHPNLSNPAAARGWSDLRLSCECICVCGGVTSVEAPGPEFKFCLWVTSDLHMCPNIWGSPLCAFTHLKSVSLN